MAKLTLSIALKYQRMSDPYKCTIGQFKANGRELRDLCGLTDREALAIIKGDDGWLDIVAAKEQEAANG